MMNCRITFTISIILLVLGALLLIRLVPWLNRTKKYDPETKATRTVSVPTNAIVSSFEIFKFEKREGMRKVRVRLTVEHEGETAQEIVITEWIPVVLLGRLRVGGSVQLINDPLQERLTFGL